MKVQGNVDTRGKLWIQRVANTFGFPHSASDEGRLVYEQDDERLWYAGSSGWINATNASDLFNQYQEMIFMSYPLPPNWQGWSPIDKAVMITNNGNQIGDYGGNWILTGMNNAGEHNHAMQRLSDNNTEVNSDGGKDVAENDHGHYIYNNGKHSHSFDSSWRPASTFCYRARYIGEDA